MGPDVIILVYWMLSFKPTFSFSSFTFIKRLFSSSLSDIRVVSSAYLRLLIFLLAVLIPACASFSPVFLMVYTAYNLSKQGDNIQPFSSISLHWSLSKAFLSLLAILWNPAFKWEYLSFSPLLFTSLLFTDIIRPPQSAIFPFRFHPPPLRMVLIPVSCTMSQTSVYSSSGTLSIRSSPLNLFFTSTVSSYRDDEIWFRSYMNGLVVFPTFFNLSLNLAIRSLLSEPQSAPGLVFADCIEVLHLCLQII